MFVECAIFRVRATRQAGADGRDVRKQRGVRPAQRRLQLEGRPERDAVGSGCAAVRAPARIPACHPPRGRGPPYRRVHSHHRMLRRRPARHRLRSRPTTRRPVPTSGPMAVATRRPTSRLGRTSPGSRCSIRRVLPARGGPVTITNCRRSLAEGGRTTRQTSQSIGRAMAVKRFARGGRSSGRPGDPRRRRRCRGRLDFVVGSIERRSRAPVEVEGRPVKQRLKTIDICDEQVVVQPNENDDQPEHDRLDRRRRRTRGAR